MLPLTQSCSSTHRYSIKYKYSSSDIKPDIKQGIKSSSFYRKIHKIGLSFVLVVLSFSTVGCATIQALEPTAVLISDMKNIL